MTKITAESILEEVRDIIANASHGKLTTPGWVTAYNVLHRLSLETYKRLVADHGEPGKGAGSHHSSAQVVKNALKMLSNNGEVEIIYADANGENWYNVHGVKIQPGNVTVGMYRYVG